MHSPSVRLPNLPSSIARRMRWAAGQKRRWKMTPNLIPACSAAAIIRSASVRRVVTGFSQRTLMPASAAAMTSGVWLGCGVQTTTASHLAAAEQRVGVREDARDVVMLRHRPRPVDVDVRAGDEIGLRQRRERRRVRLRDVPAANQPDPYRSAMHHCSLRKSIGMNRQRRQRTPEKSEEENQLFFSPVVFLASLASWRLMNLRVAGRCRAGSSRTTRRRRGRGRAGLRSRC